MSSSLNYRVPRSVCGAGPTRPVQCPPVLSHALRVPGQHHASMPRIKGITRSSKRDNGEINRGLNIEKEKGAWRLSLGESQLLIPESAVLMTGLALLGIGAILGPIIIGLIATAVSIGFTVSVGALALSTMFIPMLLFSIIAFGFFSSFAMFGVGVFMPNLFPLVSLPSSKFFQPYICTLVNSHDVQIVTGAGLAIGWTAVRMFVPKEDKGKSDGSKKSVSNKEEMASPKSFSDKDKQVEISPEEQEVGLQSRNSCLGV